MKNPPGLVKISTGGSANTTSVEVDGVPVLAKRATIIIDPENGENQIKLHCYSRQNNRYYEDGEVQTFYGISKENYEFFKGLMKLVSEIPDSEFADKTYWEQHTSEPVQNVLRFIEEARKVANEQA